MSTVFVAGVPPEVESYLADRHRRGQDRHDEVWNGDLHIVSPGPSIRHALVNAAVMATLAPYTQGAGLTALIGSTWVLPITIGFRTTGTSAPLTMTPSTYRLLPSSWRCCLPTTRAPSRQWGGRVDYAKLDFYSQHGVEEVFIVDPLGESISIWNDSKAQDRSDVLQVSTQLLSEIISWP